MKVCDLVKVSHNIHAEHGWIGVIIEDIFNRGKAFKVLFSHGRIRAKFRRQLEIVNESR